MIQWASPKVTTPMVGKDTLVQGLHFILSPILKETVMTRALALCGLNPRPSPNSKAEIFYRWRNLMGSFIATQRIPESVSKL